MYIVREVRLEIKVHRRKDRGRITILLGTMTIKILTLVDISETLVTNICKI